MIPEPFFDATTRNYTIEHGVTQRNSARAIRGGERALGAFKLPPFQRPSVWTHAQDEQFIESIWLHLPIASYVINRDDEDDKGYPCDDWLLDGQQRWTAIINYVKDHFHVFGILFGDLPLAKRRKFMNHPFPCVEARNLTPERCQDVYNRLAYGGTNHAPRSGR